MPLANLRIALENEKQRHEFCALWQAQTGLEFDQALLSAGDLQPGSNILPKDFFRGASQPYDISTKAELVRSKLKTTLPAKPSDALWQFNCFLQDVYPSGGIVDFANSEKFPHAQSIWIQLASFSQSAKYSNHPQISHIAAIAVAGQQFGTTNKWVTTLGIAIEILRPPMTKKGIKVQQGNRNSQLYKTTYHVGVQLPPNLLANSLVLGTQQSTKPRKSDVRNYFATVPGKGNDGRKFKRLKLSMSDDEIEDG